MSAELSGHFPSEVLERRADEQRQQIHNSVSELRQSLTELKSTVKEKVRERLDVKSHARRHLGSLAAGASVCALLAGYGMAGMFTRR